MLLIPFLPLGSNIGRARAVMAQATDGAGAMPDGVMDGYPEDATDAATDAAQLDDTQRGVLRAIAERIVASHFTERPIDAVTVLGHADEALKKAPAERAAFELQVSQQRASSARQMLLAEVQALAQGAHFSNVLLCDAVGMGNKRPIVVNAADEAQMKKNRRVEIYLFESPLRHAPCDVH